ncbi:hypothetical protein ABZR00_19415 [Pseudomonas aeruginosa]
MTASPKKPFYRDLTFQVIAAMALGIAFGFVAPELAAQFKILAACRTFPLAGRIAHRSWNLTV